MYMFISVYVQRERGERALYVCILSDLVCVYVYTRAYVYGNFYENNGSP